MAPLPFWIEIDRFSVVISSEKENDTEEVCNCFQERPSFLAK